jgi:MOSC domain-containing protein YiiM
MTDDDGRGLERGRLEAIWVKRVRRGPMDERRRARLIAGKGLEDDANLGMKRQVTILSRERWEDVCRALGRDLDPTVRRANLLVSGLALRESRGRVLRIGESRIYVNGETRPCRAVDEAVPGLREALDPQWRGGVYGEVLEGGEIAVGDPVAWEDP